MNRVVLFGRLGRDPQLRVKAPVAHFSLAVSEPYTDTTTGERIERVTWFHIVAWDRLSEIASQYLKKGDQVLVEGKIQLREFEGRDGTKRAMLQVIARRIEFGAKSSRVEHEAGDTSPFSDPKDGGDEVPRDLAEDLVSDGGTEDFSVADDDIPF